MSRRPPGAPALGGLPRWEPVDPGIGLRPLARSYEGGQFGMARLASGAQRPVRLRVMAPDKHSQVLR